MANWTFSRVFSMIMFFAMMAFFFIWIIGQINDLTFYFGFRTSHTIANDMANAMTSLAAVPGDAKYTYRFGSAGDLQAGGGTVYDILIADKIVCVTSYLQGGSAESTTDCAAQPYDVKELSRKGVSSVCIYFEKTMVKTDGVQDSEMAVSDCGGV